MMEKKQDKQIRRKYDEGFKTEAFRMVSTVRSIPDVTRSLGVSENLLYKWRSEQNPSYTPEEAGQQAELESLLKQLKQVEMERDILKKALAIFGRTT